MLYRFLALVQPRSMKLDERRLVISHAHAYCADREFWMNYRRQGFLNCRIIWLLPHSPHPRRQVASLSQSSCVSSVVLMTARKPVPLKSFNTLSELPNVFMLVSAFLYEVHYFYFPLLFVRLFSCSYIYQRWSVNNIRKPQIFGLKNLLDYVNVAIVDFWFADPFFFCVLQICDLQTHFFADWKTSSNPE